MEEEIILLKFKEFLNGINIKNIELDLKENDTIYLKLVSDDFVNMSHSERVVLIAKDIVGFTYEIFGNHDLMIIALTEKEELTNQLIRVNEEFEI